MVTSLLQDTMTLLVCAHEAAVAFYLGTQDGGELAFNALYCHGITRSML